MAGGFDASQAVGAGLRDQQRVWDFIAGFAAAWTQPLGLDGGYSEAVLQVTEERLGMRLPSALREAYRLFGRRRDLTANQDPLVPPNRLRMDSAEELIVFRRENQGCAEWGVVTTDPRNHDDPPVYVRRLPPGQRWEPFADRVSLACAEMVLSEAALGSEFMDMCELRDREHAAMAESAYRQVTLPECPLWYYPGRTSRWFAAPGKLLRIDGGEPGFWLVAAGQTSADLESIHTAIPGPWSPRPRTGRDAGQLLSHRRGGAPRPQKAAQPFHRLAGGFVGLGVTGLYKGYVLTL